MSKKYRLSISYRNGDTGETFDNQLLELSSSEGELSVKADTFVTTNDHDSFDIFIKALIGNGEMDSPSYGICYEEAFSIASRVAWEKLGWHDCIIHMDAVYIGEERVELDEDIADHFELQLSRESGFMYLYNE